MAKQKKSLFNVRLSETDSVYLTEVSYHTGINKSEIIRLLIRKYYREKVAHEYSRPTY